MKQEHIKSYYTINGLCLFIVCVILTSDLPPSSLHIQRQFIYVQYRDKSKNMVRLGVSIQIDFEGMSLEIEWRNVYLCIIFIYLGVLY